MSPLGFGLGSSRAFGITSRGIIIPPPPAAPYPAISWSSNADTASSLDFEGATILIETGGKSVTVVEADHFTAGSSIPASLTNFGYAGKGAQLGGRALQLTNGSLINFSNWQPFDTGVVWTIEMWFRLRPYNNRIMSLVSGTDNTNGRTFFVSINSSGALELLNWTASPAAVSSATYKDNTWHHFSLVRGNDNMYMRVDGNFVGSVSAGFFTSVATQRFRIGNFTGPNPVAENLVIDGFRVSNILRYPADTTNVTPPVAPS